jgi:glycosyltransferase involved in cell wall biosynthesis
MRVLFFTFAYPPLKYPRSIQISRLTRYSRHTISIVCGDEASPKDPTILPAIEASAPRVTRYWRPGRLRFDPRRFVEARATPDVYRRWAAETAADVLRKGMLSPDDVLVTFGQPMSDHLAGLELKRRVGVRWVAHFSDPWAANPYHQQSTSRRRRNAALERSVIESADLVLFTSEETANITMRAYPPAWRERVGILPHAFDPAMYAGDSSLADGRIVVRSLGNFYEPRTPEPLLRAVAALEHARPDVAARLSVELIGNFPRSFANSPELRSLEPGRARLVPAVAYAESLRLMRAASVLVVIDAAFEQSVFLPSKLIDYVGAGRPILGITPSGTSARVIQRLGGRVAHPADTDGICTALAELIDDTSGMPGDVVWGAPDVRAEYDARSVVARFDTFIDSVRA